MTWRARAAVLGAAAPAALGLGADGPASRTYYVDGSPQQADAWLYPTPTATDPKAASGHAWRPSAHSCSPSAAR